MDIETDYLVVGAGACGLAFTDSLLTEADLEIVQVDKRSHPGGHWRDVYPFVQLHAASTYYGVSSMPLGRDQIMTTGRNAGFYEQAGADELRPYFEAVVEERLAPSGRARFLGGHEHLGGEGAEHRVRDLDTGEVHTVHVRRRLVDARYTEGAIPATHTPSFTVAPAASFIPVNGLPDAVDGHRQFTIVGAGKTSADACLFLFDQGVTPDRIRWIRPRDSWFTDRASLQPLDQVAALMEGISFDAEAAAQADTLTEMFEQLEDRGRLMRIDPTVEPTMYRGTMLSRPELADLRQIEDVVRLGRVRAIEADRIVLDEGEIPTGPDVLHVDCSAVGLNSADSVPVFSPGRIVIQQIRQASPTFNAALIAWVEAHRDDDTEKNRLCPPVPYASTVADWGPLMGRTWAAEQVWLNEPEVSAWIGATRLNVLKALPEHLHEPRAQEAVDRFVTHVGPAIERLVPAAR